MFSLKVHGWRPTSHFLLEVLYVTVHSLYKDQLSDWLPPFLCLYVSRPVAGQLPRLRQTRAAVVTRRNVPWAPWARRLTTQAALTTAPFPAALLPLSPQPPLPPPHWHGSAFIQTHLNVKHSWMIHDPWPHSFIRPVACTAHTQEKALRLTHKPP